MTTTTTRSQVVLRFHNETHNTVSFIAAYDDTQQIYRTLQLTVQDWEEMGSPTELTIDIRPGDKLNEPG